MQLKAMRLANQSQKRGFLSFFSKYKGNINHVLFD